jgi:hypothetical protein
VKRDLAEKEVTTTPEKLMDAGCGAVLIILGGLQQSAHKKARLEEALLRPSQHTAGCIRARAWTAPCGRVTFSMRQAIQFLAGVCVGWAKQREYML